MTGFAIDEAVLKGHCVKALHSVRDRNLPVTAPMVFLSLFTFLPGVKLSKAVRKLVKVFIIWGKLVDPLLLSSPLIQITAAAVMCD